MSEEKQDETRPAPPWFSVELDGVVLHVPLRDGSVFTVPMTPEGFFALIGEAVERLDAFKASPDLQKRVLGKALELGIDWLAKRKR